MKKKIVLAVAGVLTCMSLVACNTDKEVEIGAVSQVETSTEPVETQVEVESTVLETEVSTVIETEETTVVETETVTEVEATTVETTTEAATEETTVSETETTTVEETTVEATTEAVAN